MFNYKLTSPSGSGREGRGGGGLGEDWLNIISNVGQAKSHLHLEGSRIIIIIIKEQSVNVSCPKKNFETGRFGT